MKSLASARTAARRLADLICAASGVFLAQSSSIRSAWYRGMVQPRLVILVLFYDRASQPIRQHTVAAYRGE
jgi:hypothetical protein